MSQTEDNGDLEEMVLCEDQEQYLTIKDYILKPLNNNLHIIHYRQESRKQKAVIRHKPCQEDFFFNTYEAKENFKEWNYNRKDNCPSSGFVNEDHENKDVYSKITIEWNTPLIEFSKKKVESINTTSSILQCVCNNSHARYKNFHNNFQKYQEDNKLKISEKKLRREQKIKELQSKKLEQGQGEIKKLNEAYKLIELYNNKRLEENSMEPWESIEAQKEILQGVELTRENLKIPGKKANKDFLGAPLINEELSQIQLEKKLKQKILSRQQSSCIFSRSPLLCFFKRDKTPEAQPREKREERKKGCKEERYFGEKEETFFEKMVPGTPIFQQSHNIQREEKKKKPKILSRQQSSCIFSYPPLQSLK